MLKPKGTLCEHKKENMKKIPLLLAPLSFLFFSIANAQSDVYLCIDDKGKSYHATNTDPEKCKKIDLPGITSIPSPQKVNAAQRKARQAKGGVFLGMTKEQALASNWGRPQRINSTHNARGVHEQWVYGNGNYLYFYNGILESFQN